MPLSRDEIVLLTGYEQEMTALRRLLADGLYWGCRRSLEGYTAFAAEFGPGGRYESLAEQYGADSAAISAEDVATLVGAMEVIIATMESVEAQAPGLWGIPVREAGER